MNPIKIAASTYDSGRVRLGGSARLPAAKPATADSVKVILGGSARLPKVHG